MSVLTIETAEVFRPLLEPARYKAAFGGRGSGKSHFFAGLLIEDALRNRGLLAVCVRQVHKSLRESSKRLIETKLIEFGLGEKDGFKVFKEVIRTPGDGLIIFQGMQDHTAESIKSLEGYTRAWWEEAQVATQHSLDLLCPTLRASGSELWFIWNPRRKSDPIDRMFRGAEKPSGAVVVQANWKENPWLTNELEQERHDCLRIRPDSYPHIWEGDYVSAAAGAYFAQSLSEAKAQGRISNVARDPLMALRTYWDIGGTGAKADACAIWVAQFVGREVRVLDYYEAQGQPLANPC